MLNQLVYALLPDKTQGTCDRLFNLMAQHLKIYMTTIKCYYEIALINYIKKHFQKILLLGLTEIKKSREKEILNTS